ERPDVHLLGNDRKGGVETSVVGEQLGEPLAILAAKRQQEEEARWVRRPHDVAQDRRTVPVGPLHVVDPEKYAMARAKPGQHVAQRGDRTAPKFERFRRLVARSGTAKSRYALQYGEESGQRGSVLRNQASRLVGGQRQQRGAETVDHRVDGLVRD